MKNEGCSMMTLTSKIQKLTTIADRNLIRSTKFDLVDSNLKMSQEQRYPLFEDEKILRELCTHPFLLDQK